MIKYKVEKTPNNPKEYLEILKTRWINNWEWQQDKFWYMIFYKKETIPKKTTPKEQIEEKLYYSESFVKGCCSYYKDIETLFKDWREQRKECKQFKPYTERSEKVTWNKISKFPKAIVEEMLNKAITWSWGRLIDLESYEIEKIMLPVRNERRKEEAKLEWFTTQDDKIQAERRKKQIQDYINANPWIRIEATLFVEEKHSNLEWVYKEKMITAKMASIANNNI